jgi:hypothetical protein
MVCGDAFTHETKKHSPVFWFSLGRRRTVRIAPRIIHTSVTVRASGQLTTGRPRPAPGPSPGGPASTPVPAPIRRTTSTYICVTRWAGMMVTTSTSISRTMTTSASMMATRPTESLQYRSRRRVDCERKNQESQHYQKNPHSIYLQEY